TPRAASVGGRRAPGAPRGRPARSPRGTSSAPSPGPGPRPRRSLLRRLLSIRVDLNGDRPAVRSGVLVPLLRRGEPLVQPLEERQPELRVARTDSVQDRASRRILQVGQPPLLGLPAGIRPRRLALPQADRPLGPPYRSRSFRLGCPEDP